MNLKLRRERGLYWSLGAQLLVLFGLGAVIVSGVPDDAGAQETAQNQSVSSVDQMYVHPEQKFAILIPKHTETMMPDGPVDLAMRSRNGWMVNIQSSPANQMLSTEQMAGRFEAEYLGMDKPWTQKLSSSFEGGDRYVGVYDGSGSRVQVVIKRTRSWDFVLLFMAPGESFAGFSNTFHRILSSFQVPETGLASRTEIESASATASSGSGDGEENQWKRMNDHRLGYGISYPANWLGSRPDDFTMAFSGTAGTEQGYAVVSIRNVAVSNAVPREAMAEGMLQQLRAQMAYADANITHDRTGPISIGQGNNTVDGLQMMSSFKRGDASYRQWTVAVPRREGNVVHVWTYVAPTDLFLKYRRIAENMAGSLELLAVTAQ